MMFVLFNSNTTGVTSGAGTAFLSGAHVFTPYFSGVRVTRSLVLCVCFVDRCLSFCTFSFGLCAVCPPIYEFGLLLWYLQILLNRKDTVACTIYISSMTRNKK